MVNPEDQAPVQPQATSVENHLKSEFLDKMSEIPAVNTAKELGTSVYNQVKGYNRFTSAALSAAENTALYFAVTAKPFLEKVQPQAKAVDHLACEGLLALEQNFPFLLKPTDEIVGDARKLVSSTIEMAGKKVDNVKNFGIQKVSEALDETESFVDRYIPPAFGEGAAEATAASDSLPERASKLTNKIGLRLYGHGVKKFLPIHNLGQESVFKLNYIIALLQTLKEGVSNKTMQDYVDEAKLKAMWIWDELNKEPAESAEAEKSLEQRSLSLARRTTSILVQAYSVTTLPLSALPSTYQEGFQTASRYATELFTQLDQVTNAGEITINWLQSIRQRVAALEEIIQNLKSQEIEMESLEKEPDSVAVPEPSPQISE